jgi:predicted nuclease of restriction endonuclease-like (RecB) superfamily
MSKIYKQDTGMQPPIEPAKPAGGSVTEAVKTLLPQIRRLIEDARHHAVAAANLSMVSLYWSVGRIISTEIQRRPGRADYGEALLARLAERLRLEYGPGFSRSNLQDMRRFHEAFEICQTVSGKSSPTAAQEARGIVLPEKCQTPSGELPSRLLVDFGKHFHLSWSHYRLLLVQEDPIRRHFYFEQAATQRWSFRELRRQMSGALFERVALSSDTRALVKLEKKKGAPEIANYRDAFKDPYLLDFLGLTGAYSEKDLEAAIITNLQQFLTELGSDFCFIRRQYPMRIDDEDYFLDLLFYHRVLRCLVAVDLKIGPFVAADKGQMDLYLSWLKRHEWREHENEPVGLILCTSKKRQHVELLLANGPHKMQVSEYLTKLPDKKVLEERLKLYGRMLEKGEI